MSGAFTNLIDINIFGRGKYDIYSIILEHVSRGSVFSKTNQNLTQYCMKKRKEILDFLTAAADINDTEDLKALLNDEKLAENLILRCYRESAAIRSGVIEDPTLEVERSRARFEHNITLHGDGTLSYVEIQWPAVWDYTLQVFGSDSLIESIDEFYNKGNFLIYHQIKCHIIDRKEKDEDYEKVWNHCVAKIREIEQHFSLRPQSEQSSKPQGIENFIH